MPEPPIGEVLPLWSVIPFVGILLSIALMPLAAPHVWHRHYPKIALFWALVFAVPFVRAFGGDALREIVHIFIADYLPFLILLGGLFTVAGGISVRGAPPATPAVNTGLLAAGTFLASWIGTTGAAMLLIRPLLRANAQRKRRVHLVVFFTFLVANVGGGLTPLGDPPLFLGFLHGVPFFWTLRLLPHVLFCSAVLLALFFLIDRRHHRAETLDVPRRMTPSGERVSVDGLVNVLFLGGIVGAVLLSGLWKSGSVRVLGVERAVADLARDGITLSMAALSLAFTRRAVRRANEFSWGPIREVAYLFAGIFMTIIPAIAILKAGERGHLGFLIAAAQHPWQYFWLAGGLSSFLDNAPTYLTFFNTLLGRFSPGQPETAAVPQILAHRAVFLEAVAAGAVFMGANTYIGNAPNFMVKSIAEESGVAMPSFFGYIIRWSLPILVPLFLAVGWIFFRG